MKKNALKILLLICLLNILIVISPLAKAATIKTQLCLVIDGSGSISTSEWKIITQAISKAINETIPHDNSIELSIVQFGYTAAEGYAKTELQPTIIGYGNFASIAAQVAEIPKANGGTPTAHGLYIGWNELKNSPNFNENVKQVMNLASDGIPNERNFNATIDLDENGGINAKDDVIAVVNMAVTQGLDELDVEGIGMAENDLNWLRNWTVRPAPGIVAPPFSKAGWIRIVADPTEFANTLNQKMEVITLNSDSWVPPAEGALYAGLLTVGVTSIFSMLGSALSNPSSGLAQKISNFLPEVTKKWLHDFISSRRKLVIFQIRMNPFKLTKLEVLSYILALSILTASFVFVKVNSFVEILTVLPIVLFTSVIVEFGKNYSIEVLARKLGVWTEHRLWYFGLFAFLVSTIVFRTPFSSPSRNIHYSENFTKRSLGLVSAASVIIGFAFAVVFGFVFLCGLTLIGSFGLVMSLTMSFFEALPIPPMSGKDIYDWNRPLWIGLFLATLTLYILCLLLI